MFGSFVLLFSFTADPVDKDIFSAINQSGREMAPNRFGAVERWLRLVKLACLKRLDKREVCIRDQDCSALHLTPWGSNVMIL